jgi:hypothetical protein
MCRCDPIFPLTLKQHEEEHGEIFKTVVREIDELWASITEKCFCSHCLNELIKMALIAEKSKWKTAEYENAKLDIAEWSPSSPRQAKFRKVKEDSLREREQLFDQWRDQIEKAREACGGKLP